ncbi:methylmalonyl Co-A mutase-associated GTPase MeaB [Siculibacillus lacustris]|uniref:Methylmalonyl Co-A mutase-associated GTPase MeaB n=1 Tax=Siculibacillus lacustris TaxID=1549641 RepID=A0A4V2KSU0_9HYPH|nr:ATP/GTP-binding protein [Siculibacillus lacustris]TBW34409.1 methylmalonyl Co-A mutase-associated GTPase MeaB [Siculibacillus lacustris]
MTRPIPSLAAIRAGGKPAVARALALIETADGSAALAALLDACAAEAIGDVLGLTGPPGVGKSTLTDALIRAARAEGRSVGVVAVDPSSRLSGGALLGDRTRLATDPEDDRIFVRSMAARDRLGGLSDHAVAAIVLMRAVYDRVIVESVGIGQSEGDIAHVADCVVLCIQPGSGDSLQFMKAGVMELPDVVCVTKADMGEAARRAVADVAGALTLAAPGAPKVAVVAVSAAARTGLADLAAAIEAHRASLDRDGRRQARRAAQARHWVEDALRVRFGRRGLSSVTLPPGVAAEPFAAIVRLSADLDRRLASPT